MLATKQHLQKQINDAKETAEEKKKKNKTKCLYLDSADMITIDAFTVNFR